MKENKQEKNKKLLQILDSPTFCFDIEELSLNELRQIRNALYSRICRIKSITKMIVSSSPIIILSLIFLSNYFETKTIKLDILFTSVSYFFYIILFLVIFITINISLYLHNISDSKLILVSKKVHLLEIKNDKSKKNFLDKIFDLNMYNINEYYQQTRKHSNDILLIASIIGGIGFFCILIALLMGVFFENKISISYISTAVGIFLDSFAGFFFVQYSRTTKNMQVYFEGLLKTQEKIMDANIDVVQKC